MEEFEQVGDLKFGCIVNGATHQDTNIPDITIKVQMVKEAGGFDYFDGFVRTESNRSSSSS